MKAKSISRGEYKALIKNLINARKEAKISQEKLAKILGWSQAEISKYEHFVRRIDAIELVDICQAIGISYKQVLDKSLKNK